LGQDAEFAFNYKCGGSWESTRNLKLSAKGGFLPWLIGGSIAPRGLVYGHEFAWDKDRDPVWARFNTIWGFYDAKDKLAASAGRGSVKGKPPESTHCNNIGYEHRKPIYPTLTKWFGLPIPEENKKRYLSSELQCWTDDARQTLKPKTMLETIAQMETRRMVWLNDPDLKSLYVRLSPVVGEDMAKFVILYREYGPTNLAPNPRVQVSRLSDYQFPPKFRQGNYSLASPLDLIGSGVAITRMEGIRTVRRIYECPLNDKTKWPDLLPKLFAGTTLYDPAETSEPRERINVASASPQELAKLNLSDADIQKIITVRRGLTAAELETPAWLITEAQISLRAIGDRTFFASITSKAPTDPQKQWLRLLGVNASADLPCKVEWLADTTLPGKHFVGIGVFRQEGKPALAVPVVTIRPAGAKGKIPVVIALAQEGKAGFFKHRAETIAKLLEGGVAVCLPDLRGTGETAADGRGRQSGGTSYSASLLMHGQTAPGVQLQELVMVIRELPKQGFGNIALWGDSFAEPNDPKTEFAKPYDVSNMPRQSEPMGGTLALLGGLFGGDSVKAIYVRGGMVSFKSMLDSPFCYFPHDAVIPGVLPASDLPTLAEAHAKRGLRLEALVDGLNRRVDDKTLKAAYRAAMFSRPAHDLMVLREQPSSAAEVAAWLAGRVKR
ncbi:MAG: hypothetical protein HYR84_09955, partial [Planctomycetes bacterium]|nr:hypothetical protein [Planctomycetota bacterium]